MAMTTLAARVVLGGGAGLLAAFVMNYPMVRQSEGYLPAYVAASVVLGSAPEEVDGTAAGAVHHAAGILAGVLYALGAFALPVVVPAGPTVAGEPLLPHLLSAVCVAAFVTGFFNYLVLPVAGDVARDRLPAVRRQWVRSTLVFWAVLAGSGPLLAALARA